MSARFAVNDLDRLEALASAPVVATVESPERPGLTLLALVALDVHTEGDEVELVLSNRLGVSLAIREREIVAVEVDAEDVVLRLVDAKEITLAPVFADRDTAGAEGEGVAAPSPTLRPPIPAVVVEDDLDRIEW